ncbi:TetR/AcrR family transcriptional regulator [Aquimarina litoralis]|uniref:TetR/AcrR family transcriptional regulator n=1 Tax=Aquimarina litoralis TaxID=584605 RepID=UPI001C571893|nr:TetR/AcrR family transcriptional regulator [Aquimarina litoralis]MBW1296276.1 TetR family transcriptional regulator [Aquimarina litoralis]
MKEDTVHNILEIGTDLIIKNGYHSVGLNKILTEAKIPKGSFYYYFKSKEDFGLKVIESYSEKSIILLKGYLEDDTKDHKQRILTFFKDMKDVYVSKDYTEGCLLGNCSLELSDLSESFSNLISDKLNEWEKFFENCIREGQLEGSIKTNESAEVLSNLLLTMWEGALLRMKSAKNAKSLETFISYTEKHIL